MSIDAIASIIITVAIGAVAYGNWCEAEAARKKRKGQQ